MRYYWLRWGAILLLLAVSVIALVIGGSNQESKHTAVRAPGNVEFNYGEVRNGNRTEGSYETLDFNGEKWDLSSKDGSIIRVSEGFELKLSPGETVVESEVDYGSFPAQGYFQSVPWEGRILQFKRMFTDEKGQVHDLHVVTISVLVHKPHSPLPPLKGEMAVCTALSHREGCGWWE